MMSIRLNWSTGTGHRRLPNGLLALHACQPQRVSGSLPLGTGTKHGVSQCISGPVSALANGAGDIRAALDVLLAASQEGQETPQVDNLHDNVSRMAVQPSSSVSRWPRVDW